MKAVAVFTALYLIIYVSAYGIRGAYERVWLYYAYQLEIEAGVPAANRVMCPDCPTSGGRNYATFNEFIRYLNWLDFTPSLVDDANRLPNIEAAATKINAGAFPKGKKRVKVGLTGQFYETEYFVKGSTDYWGLLEGIGPAVRDAKAVAAANNKNVGQFAALTEQAGLRVLLERRMDGQDYIRREFVKTFGVDPSMRDRVYPGGVFSVYDSDMTKARYPASIERIQAFEDELPSETQGHIAVLERVQTSVTTMGVYCELRPLDPLQPPR